LPEQVESGALEPRLPLDLFVILSEASALLFRPALRRAGGRAVEGPAMGAAEGTRCFALYQGTSLPVPIRRQPISALAAAKGLQG